MRSAEQTGLFVHVTDGTEITAHYFKICILSDVIDGHFEHAEMEICDWTEGPARDEDDWLLSGVTQLLDQPMNGKDIVFRRTTHRRWC